MNLADLSIRRPTFITCVVLLMLAVGWVSFKKLGVDLFPNITFPVVVVTVPYPGAGPSEVETLIARPLEEEFSTVSGVKRMSSTSREGSATVVAEFTLETDVKYAEQQIRDRVSSARRRLPDDIQEPVIRRIDPADQPVLEIALAAAPGTSPGRLFELADERVKPRLEQVSQVGLVEILGGRKREIQVSLDRRKLVAREISAGAVAARLSAAGDNVPVGKVNQGQGELIFRSLGEFKSLADVSQTLVRFLGNESATQVGDLGRVVDTLADETSRVYVNGQPSLFVRAFRQSGANTIAVTDALRKRLDQINAELSTLPEKPKLSVVRDGAVWIRANVDDVKESITIGIALAVIVVFLFLGSVRSTVITGLALPNSLIGAFILMALAGFSINIMTLLALSLSVGLLIDDAIVVRENIFRHIEMGKEPGRAAREGTAEVRLAVIATTLTVIAVFGPVGFLKGMVGQFFKEFGLTICFAMMISLFDALTIAPMLSAYFAGSAHAKPNRVWDATLGRLLKAFDRFQTRLENAYQRLLKFTIRRPLVVLASALVVFVLSFGAVIKVPKTFLPPQDAGEFGISIDLPPGSNLNATAELARRIDEIVRGNPEVDVSALTVGGRNGESNVADFYVHLVPFKQRAVNTIQFKDRVRGQLAEFSAANPVVKDYDAVAGGQRPFNLNVVGDDQAELDRISNLVLAKLKAHPGLKDVGTSLRPGKPEFQVVPYADRVEALGISSRAIGLELRTQVEGVVAAKLRENGREFDIRVRLDEPQRDLSEAFADTYVPNVNERLMRLPDVARSVRKVGPANIMRQDRGRFVQISADVAPDGPGMGGVMTDVRALFDGRDGAAPEIPLPPGFRYAFVGQAENFQELGESMAMALIFGILFIFFVLASLYESFVTPLTIMLALPLAICGAFFALFVTGQSLNIFSMIGIIMLLGVAVKNSILLVDYAKQQVDAGKSRAEALLEAGRTRLRPILMTTMALIAGTIPIALGLNEASRQRTSMGVAIIGGLISSTLLTLVVVPAAYAYIDRFRIWSNAKARRLFGASDVETRDPATTPSALEKTAAAPAKPGGGNGPARVTV